MDDDLRQALQKQCRESIGRLEEYVLHETPWAPRSILMSEGFAFCAVADLLGVDMVLESGIYNGRSTQMWANYFPSSTPIIAVDKRAIGASATECLGAYENVELIRGDGPTVIDELILKFKDKRIGIFMDGPKGMLALDFAKRILSLPNVEMVAIHDMSVTQGRLQGELYYQEGRIEFDKWELGQFLTDEKWFVDEYSWLDKDESRLDVRQGFTWHPYKFIGTGRPDRELGSYGPTVGLCFEWKGIS